VSLCCSEQLTAVLKDWGTKAGTAGGMSGLTPDHVVAAALARAHSRRCMCRRRFQDRLLSSHGAFRAALRTHVALICLLRCGATLLHSRSWGLTLCTACLQHSALCAFHGCAALLSAMCKHDLCTCPPTGKHTETCSLGHSRCWVQCRLCLGCAVKCPWPPLSRHHLVLCASCHSALYG
jgi:hypothetical protein